MLEDLTKSDVVMVVGLGIAAAAISDLLPNAKPLVRSAVQFGLDLLTESEAEAEAELIQSRSEEHTSELQSRRDLVCRLLLEKKKLGTTRRCSTSRPNASL